MLGVLMSATTEVDNVFLRLREWSWCRLSSRLTCEATEPREQH